jgi:hypothetical protein
MLSFFFALNGKKATSFQAKQIRRWFWHTCINQRYSGSNFNNSIPSDIKFFRRLSEGHEPIYQIDEKVNVFDFMRTRYNESSSVSAAYALILKMQKPLYISSGRPMLLDNVSSIANKKHRHHIFPKAVLSKSGVSPKWVNSITNICFIEADQNKSFGSMLPRNYLEKFRYKRHFNRAAKSHLIPVGTSGGIWGGSVKSAFLKFKPDRQTSRS